MQSLQFSIEPQVNMVVVVGVLVVDVEVVLVDVVDVLVVDVVEVLVVLVDVVEVLVVDVVLVVVDVVDVVDVLVVDVDVVDVLVVEVVVGRTAVMLGSPYHRVSLMMAISLSRSPVLWTVIMEVSLTALFPVEQRVSLMLMVVPLISVRLK